MADARVYVAGHRGMVGAAIVRRLTQAGVTDIITRSHSELDLTSQQALQAFFAAERPRQVYLAAARVGGIHANNTYPAESIYDNLMIEANIIHAAYQHGVDRLLFLGSSCMILPINAGHPVKRVNYATEVNHDKANRKENDHPEATHSGVPDRSPCLGRKGGSLQGRQGAWSPRITALWLEDEGPGCPGSKRSRAAASRRDRPPQTPVG